MVRETSEQLNQLPKTFLSINKVLGLVFIDIEEGWEVYLFCTKIEVVPLYHLN